MKKQMWLARVAVASLVFGMAGAGSLQAAKDYTLDGGSDVIYEREIKTLCVKNDSWLAADNVKVTGGAYAMGARIEFYGSKISGDVLYAGPELVEGVPKQDGGGLRILLYHGSTSVKTLWGYGSYIQMRDHTLRADTVKLEGKGIAAANGGSFTAGNVTLSGASQLSFYDGVTANVTETMEVDEGSTLSMDSSLGAPSLTVQNLMLKDSDFYMDGGATLIVKGEMTLDASQLSTSFNRYASAAGLPSVTAQKLTIKNENLISLYNQGTMQVGTLVSDGGVTRIVGDGTLTVEEAILSPTSFQLGSESDESDPSSIKMTTKKLSLQSGELSIYSGSYEIQGEENVFGEGAKISVKSGGTFSMAEGAAIHAEADQNRKMKTVVEAEEDANVDVSKGTLYISNVKTDGKPYDISTAVMRTDTTPLGNFAKVYGASRSVVGTKIGEWQYAFGSSISEIAKDSAIPNILIAADASSGALKDFIDKAFGVGMTDAEGHNAFEREVSMAGMLGVTHGTYSFAEDMSGLIADHAGKECGIWATYVHRDRNVDGFSAIGRKAKYDMKYNGILLGGDFRTRENARTGLAFMYADGSHTGKDGVSGKADTKYYGLDVYHYFQAGGVSYKADIGYIKSDYDLEQTQLGMTVKGDVGGNAFFAGIRAEKDFACGTGKVTPYAGLRYYRVHTGDFTDSFNVKHETSTVNIWSLPLGVEFRHESKNGAWTVSPVAELGYRFILGGKDTNETMHYNTASNSYRIDVAENSFLARLGIEAESPAWSLGGGYRYQKGSNSRANEWYLQVGYRF